MTLRWVKQILLMLWNIVLMVMTSMKFPSHPHIWGILGKKTQEFCLTVLGLLSKPGLETWWLRARAGVWAPSPPCRPFLLCMQFIYVLFAFKVSLPSVAGFKYVCLLSCGTRPVIGTQSVLIRDGDGIPFHFVEVPVIDDSSWWYHLYYSCIT